MRRIEWKRHALVAAFLLFVVVSVSGLPTFAQDSEATPEVPSPEQLIVETATEPPPTETSIPPATDVPTEPPTEPPTEAPTLPPTDVPAPTETLVPTATDVATVEPTATLPDVTLTPLPTSAPLPAEPTLTPLYYETFDSTDLSRWRVGAGWLLVSSESGNALSLAGMTGSFQFAQPDLHDVVIQARFQSTQGAAQLLARQGSEGGYRASLAPDGRVELSRSGTLLGVAQVSASSGGQWRVVRLSVMGDIVRVSVDGADVIALVDPQPLTTGVVSVAGEFPPSDGTAAFAPLLVDDVAIWLREGDVPPTPTATAVIEPTQAATEPTVEATATELAPTVMPTTSDGRVIITPDVVFLDAAPQGFEQPLGFDTAAAGPAAPALTAPLENATITFARPTFRWDASTDATAYRIQIDDANDFVSPLVDVETSGLSHLPALGLARGQSTYYWRVSARNAANEWGAYSLPRSFRIIVQLTPADASFTDDTTPTLTWAAYRNATGYQVQIADNPAFSPVLYTSGSLGSTATSLTVPGGTMVTSRTYYWRLNVSVDGARRTSQFAYAFTVTPPLPPAPGNRMPLDNTATTNNRTPFTWSAVTGTAGSPFTYQIQIDNNSDFSSPEHDAIQSGTSYTPPVGQELGEGAHSWRVRTINNFPAPGAWSTTRILIVDKTAPDSPTLSSPTDQATVSSTRPTVSWGAVGGATQYRVDVDTDNAFGAGIMRFEDALSTTTSLVLPQTLAQGQYFWRAQAGDAAGNWSAESTPRRFTVFIGTSPAHGAFTSDSTPTFQWAAVSGTTGYRLQIASEPTFTAALVRSISIGNSTSYTLTSAQTLPGGTYYWRVLRRLPTAEAPVSVAYRTLFVGGTAPAAPTLTAPVNAAVLNTARPTMQWDAVQPTGITISGYQVQAATNSGFSTGVQTFSVSSTTFTPSADLPQGANYWRVRAMLGDVSQTPGTWSSTRSFTIDTVKPVPPTLNSPAEGSGTFDTTPTFTWSAVSGAVSYQTQIDTESGFVLPLTRERTDTGVTTFTPTSALPVGTLYWRMRAIDGAGNQSDWSGVRTFRVDSSSRASPLPNRFTTATPTLTWTPLAWATGYDLQIGYDSAFTSEAFRSSSLGAGAHSATSQALADGRYYWRVRAKISPTQWSSWSAVGQFTIDS